MPIQESFVVFLRHCYQYGSTYTDYVYDLIDVGKINRSIPEHKELYNFIVEACKAGVTRTEYKWEGDYNNIPLWQTEVPCYVKYELEIKFK